MELVSAFRADPFFLGKSMLYDLNREILGQPFFA
jgi:hypothetical protein